MLGFRFPEIASWLHLGDHLSRPQPRCIDIVNRIQGNLLLFFARVEDRRSVRHPAIVPLAILRRWVMDLEKELEKLSEVRLLGIEDDLDRFCVRAMVPVSGILDVTTRVTNSR